MLHIVLAELAWGSKHRIFGAWNSILQGRANLHNGGNQIALPSFPDWVASLVCVCGFGALLFLAKDSWPLLQLLSMPGVVFGLFLCFRSPFLESNRCYIPRLVFDATNETLSRHLLQLSGVSKITLFGQMLQLCDVGSYWFVWPMSPSVKAATLNHLRGDWLQVLCPRSFWMKHPLEPLEIAYL